MGKGSESFHRLYNKEPQGVHACSVQTPRTLGSPAWLPFSLFLSLEGQHASAITVVPIKFSNSPLSVLALR